MLQLLQHPVYGLIFMLVLGACIGSFLNVVILRLPVMLHNEWRQQCTELLSGDNEDNLDHQEDGQAAVFNLSFPASHCPQCQHPLRAWHNIPILSYIFLKGKCAWCKSRIPWRYPLIEILCAVATVHLAWHMGVGWPMAVSLVLVWSLLCLTVIDIDHQLLPDNLT
ncbi:MAG: prepilin peptidase, partial [bacterium]